MNPQAERKLNDYIVRINSNNPRDWPDTILLDRLGLTNEDIQPLWDAISNNRNAAQVIVKLDLSNNHLTSFRGEGLKALETLSLFNNKLTSFSSEGLGVLQMLDLACNKLTSFSGEGLGALQSLGLTNNQLTSFSSEGLGALLILNLHNNQLRSFRGEGLGKLETLRLENNQLTSFRGKGLGALKELSLHDNRLTSFRGEGLGALRWLLLYRNKLTSFSSEGLGALQELSLNRNKLTSFSSEELGALQRLYLNGNQLTSVCKIMLEAMRPALQHLDYGDPINQQVLTNEILTEHFNAVLNATQRELSNTKSWLSMVRRIRGLLDELCRMVFECVYGLDHIPQEMNRIKQALPGQTQNLEVFEKSDEFAEIKKQYDENINSLYEDSFRDARTMETLLTAYKRHGKYTTNLRYLQDNSRLDPKDNPFQLALRN